jgi:hypothetical protein
MLPQHRTAAGRKKVMDRPRTRYAKSGDRNIASQVVRGSDVLKGVPGEGRLYALER